MDEFKGQPRLPKFAIPKHYHIHLKPNLNTFKFAGSLAVDLDIVSATKFIVLNAADLSITPASVSFTATSQAAKPVKSEAVEADEILIFEFPEAISVGLGVLKLEYEGVLNDKLKGFYRSAYTINGEKKHMAVTQFEPVDARRCFPCWDEPALKATFKITLDAPSELVALSNMPVMEEKVDGSIKTLIYQDTPLMSTYLVAVVIGLLDYVEDHTADGVKVRVYSQVGKADQAKFALDVAVKTLEFYKQYFSIPYLLPKLDLIAIPDFSAGAMENYGLVTFRETALLFDDQRSAAANKQRVAEVVAHELAHQWFGDLVTMEWWTHLWLNEGFATWMSHLANDNLFPEWKIWNQFLGEFSDALRLDSLEESHPIEVEIRHASEINEIFDAISYQKGASVLRMLQNYLGAEPFQRSIASYISKHAHSNAKTEDLWIALEEGSGKPVRKLMNLWTKQKGYPIVAVNLTKDKKLEFEQSQFLLNGSTSDSHWIVPISSCYGSYNANKSFLLESKRGTLDIKEFLGSNAMENNTTWIKGSIWLKINVDQTGFYRVKYDDDLAARLRRAIGKKCLNETDRFGILDDAFALCMARHQPLTSLLTLMGAYWEELEYTVLSNLITISYTVGRVVADATPELLKEVKQFFINLFQYSAEKLGWDAKQGESHLDSMLRGELLTALAVFGHDLTIDEAIRRFRAFLDDRNTPLLPPDVRRAAYVSVMQRVTVSNKWGYESLLRVYRETDLSQEKTRILGSLASCPDPDMVFEILNFLLTPEVRSQDVVYGLAVSKEGRETAWKWLKENWEQISNTWGSGFLLTRIVSSIVSPFASFEKAKEVEEFFSSRSKPSMARTLKQSIERVHIKAQWVDSVRNEKQLKEVVAELAHRKY
ncbi:Aminopeptidase M1 [Linum perenne]